MGDWLGHPGPVSQGMSEARYTSSPGLSFLVCEMGTTVATLGGCREGSMWIEHLAVWGARDRGWAAPLLGGSRPERDSYLPTAS